MALNDLKHIHLGDNILSEKVSEGQLVSKLKSESGKGQMAMRQIIDGVYIVFSDFNLEKCDSQLRVDTEVLCIDHCREGRIEHALPNGIYSYISDGDLRVDNRKSHCSSFSMPLSHYSGITIAFFLDTAEKSIAEAMPGFPVNLRKLYEKYCPDTDPFILRAESQIEHIFSELYRVPAEIKDYYYRIKVFELLLYLDALNIESFEQKRPYFYKSQVEKVKAIAQLITKEPDSHYTLEELSTRFNIPQTAMKLCFKGVFGSSIYSYDEAPMLNFAHVTG
ncbi:MAG: hypothetical protein PQJ46_10115 [Spirochaetales bacterium]|nr:hypothetical protein [Spirochaetales bacterium]